MINPPQPGVRKFGASISPLADSSGERCVDLKAQLEALDMCNSGISSPHCRFPRMGLKKEAAQFPLQSSVDGRGKGKSKGSYSRA